MSQPLPTNENKIGICNRTWRLDIVAGLTAAAVVLPNAMAYATVAMLFNPQSLVSSCQERF
jgi:MFS superfamily sulfate permease-like transporter